MSSTAPITGVLMIGFGGPTRPDEIRPFLNNILRGRNVPPERLEEVAHHYEAVGGASPYNHYTFEQAEALRTALRDRGIPLPVYVGMRNWHPYLNDTLAQMHADGVRRCAGIILAPHRSQTSWERYQQDVERARAANGGLGLEVVYNPPWHVHPLFLEAMAQRIEEVTGQRRGAWPPDVPLIFTAHAIPASMPGAEQYANEVTESAAGIAALVGAPDWAVGYQSRSGDPRTPWLAPDLEQQLREAGERGAQEVVVVPVGFLCDHVEVLYDLDIEAQAQARALGLQMVRVPTVGSHPLFIDMLGELVERIIHELAV